MECLEELRGEIKCRKLEEVEAEESAISLSLSLRRPELPEWRFVKFKIYSKPPKIFAIYIKLQIKISLSMQDACPYWAHDIIGPAKCSNFGVSFHQENFHLFRKRHFEESTHQNCNITPLENLKYKKSITRASSFLMSSQSRDFISNFFLTKMSRNLFIEAIFN